MAWSSCYTGHGHWVDFKFSFVRISCFTTFSFLFWFWLPCEPYQHASLGWAQAAVVTCMALGFAWPPLLHQSHMEPLTAGAASRHCQAWPKHLPTLLWNRAEESWAVLLLTVWLHPAMLSNILTMRNYSLQPVLQLGTIAPCTVLSREAGHSQKELAWELCFSLPL